MAGGQGQQGGANVWKVLGIGCLVLMLLVVVGGGLGAWYVYKNAHRALAALGREMAVQIIQDSGMSEEQQKAFVFQVDRLTNAVKEGRLGAKDFENFATRFAESPLLPMALVEMAERQYLRSSGLSDEEKAAGTNALNRFANGAFEKDENGQRKIGKTDVDEVLDLITIRKTGGGKGGGEHRELKKSLTDEEVRALVARAKEKADAAGIPEEVPEVDPADEFRKLVDEILAKKQPR
jgi:hypothetical protein